MRVWFLAPKTGGCKDQSRLDFSCQVNRGINYRFRGQIRCFRHRQKKKLRMRKRLRDQMSPSVGSSLSLALFISHGVFNNFSSSFEEESNWWLSFWCDDEKSPFSAGGWNKSDTPARGEWVDLLTNSFEIIVTSKTIFLPPLRKYP